MFLVQYASSLFVIEVHDAAGARWTDVLGPVWGVGDSVIRQERDWGLRSLSRGQGDFTPMAAGVVLAERYPVRFRHGLPRRDRERAALVERESLGGELHRSD